MIEKHMRHYNGNPGTIVHMVCCKTLWMNKVNHVQDLRKHSEKP